MEPEGSLPCAQVLTTIHILSQLNFIHILPTYSLTFVLMLLSHLCHCLHSVTFFILQPVYYHSPYNPNVLHN